MKRLSNWYWQFAGARDGKWVLSPNWLDAVMTIQESDKHISAFENLPPQAKKATLAFWGPSQGGKSTFFSHYVDETAADGTTIIPEKSAMTWDNNHKVIFSGEAINYPDCTIFNPSNAGMDASGVVTRFYSPVNEADVDTNFPAEIVFAPPALILQSLALGYITHFKQIKNILTLDDITEKIVSLEAATSSAINPEAFLLLRILCNACEQSNADRFIEFREDPDRKLRNQILKSPALNSNYESAKAFATFLLWDENPYITRLWENIERFRSSLAISETDRIFASMKVASLIENISSAGDNSKEAEINSICFRREGNRLLLFENTESSSGLPLCSLPAGEAKAFAYFQALVGELKVPLKANSDSPKSKVLFDLLKKNDIIDIPGVTNKSDAALKLQIQEYGDRITDNDMLTSVYKLGKTLAIVYSQAEQKSIDAFMIFISLDRTGGLERPDVLNGGIKAWLDAFAEPSDFKTRPNLRLYINLSRFGSALSGSPSNSGYSEWVEILKKLSFSNKHCTDFLFSTNKFAKCNEKMVNDWLKLVRAGTPFNDYCFNASSEASLNALINDPEGLGSDYIITRLSSELNYSKREEIYQRLNADNREKLARKIAETLPSDGGNETMLRRSLLKEILQKAEDLSAQELMAHIKEIFDVPAIIFDKIPIKTSNIQISDLQKYLKKQISEWCKFQKEKWESNTNNKLIPINDGNISRFFEIISSIDIDALAKEMKMCFAYLGNARSPSSTTNARTYVAMMLANLFLHGSIERKEKKYSKPTDMLNIPFRDRLEYLIENTPGASARPDFPGDLEMADIQKDLQNQGKC